MQPMHSALNGDLVTALASERLERAERFRRSRVEWASVKPDPGEALTIRLARPDDARDLERLAQVEGRGLPPSPALLAEANGQVVAARSLANGAAIADPFRPTAHALELLELRSLHFRDSEPPRRPRRMMALLRAISPVRG
jgi:hypothetical protein